MNVLPATETSEGSFVSFSTNYEDVVLRRLFPDRTSGYFVDVGAQHPFLGNDFFALYARGWTGINIEPNPSYFAMLQEFRPRDRNLQLALSEVAGQDLAFFEVADTGLSTCDQAQAQACLARGLAVTRHDVHSSTLRDVMESAGQPHVDILKVDVEGLEEKVLRGNDWQLCRPSIVMVEVTYPETAVRRPTGIRDSLEAHGYRHIYFDNLNDFFAEAGFIVPEGALVPPNVFDNFVQCEMLSLREEAASLRTSFSTAAEYARSLETSRDSLEAYGKTLQTEFASLHLRNTRMVRIAAEAAATVAGTRDVAVAALLGRHALVRVLLAPELSAESEQQGKLLVPEESRELVTIAGGGVNDEGEMLVAPSADDTRAALVGAQLQALDEQNRKLNNEIDDLRHENRRLAASVRQTQGENIALQRALGPSYATRDELHQLCDRIASLQATVAESHRSLSADFEARVRTEVDEKLDHLASIGGLTKDGLPADGHESVDGRLLEAMLASTSWRVTKPLRAIRRLFGPAGD